MVGQPYIDFVLCLRNPADGSATCDFFLLELLGIDGDLELAAVPAWKFDMLGDGAFDSETTSYHENPDSILLCPSSFLEYSGTYIVRVGNLDTLREIRYNLLLRNRSTYIESAGILIQKKSRSEIQFTFGGS